MLERAWQATFRNYATLFLIVASVIVPLHLVYGFAFHKVIAVSELHGEIAAFQPDEKVKGVSAANLTRYRQVGWALGVLELALVPLFVAAARRVIEEETAGHLPAVSAALAQAIRRTGPAEAAGTTSGLSRGRHRAPEVAIVGVLVALCVWLLVRTTGMILIEGLPDDLRFAGASLTEGLSLATAAPFLLVPVVFSSSRRVAPT